MKKANRLFKQLCTPQVLKYGWHLAQDDSRNDFITDPAGNLEFAETLRQRIDFLVQELSNNRYRPHGLLELDVPKSGLSVRPGSVLPIETATVLHAIVLLLAPRLDRELHSSVFSYRLAPDYKRRIRKGRSIFREGDREIPFLKWRTIRSIDPLRAWYRAWPAFSQARKVAISEEGYTHLTKTDITAYFENIDLSILEHLLLKHVRGEDRLIHLLMSILNAWTRITATGTPVGRGIPQGNSISSFLGNIYLLPYDEKLLDYCRGRKAKWYRYVDDVEIFTRDERDAREVVFVANEVLRTLHLNLQGSKTVVLSGHDAVRATHNSALQEVDAAVKQLGRIDCRSRRNARKVTQCLEPAKRHTRQFRRGLPASVRNMEPYDSRVLRRGMTAFALCGRPWLRKTALCALRELPEQRMLTKSLRYLTDLHYRHHDEIAEELLSIVEGGELPFPFQTAAVLDAFRWLHPNTPSGMATRIRKLIRRKTEWMVLQKAGEAILTFPYRDRWVDALSKELLNNVDPWVRKTGCVLMTRCNASDLRDAIREIVYHPDPAVSQLGLLWNRYEVDGSFALATLTRFRNGRIDDHAFIQRLPALYALGCTNKNVVKDEHLKYLSLHNRSKSNKIQWHLDRLGDRVAS